MLKDQSENISTPGADESDNDEELYQRLFKKIARDFVCKSDSEDMFQKILKEVKEDEEEVENVSFGAIMKAIEYRENLSLPKSKRRKYKDVIEDDK